MKIEVIGSVAVITLLIVVGCGDSGGAGGAGSGGAGSTTTASGVTGTTSASQSATSTGGPTGTAATGGMGDTWTNFGQTFFATYCVECHGAGNAMRDYTTLAGVMKDSAAVRCGTAPVLEPNCTGTPAPKQFPISNATNSNPKPSDATRSRVVAWIDAGLPN